MVIGNGLLARAFAPYAQHPDIVVFASGVSNSQEKAPEEFQKERDLFSKTMEKSRGLIVYFSTCSIYDVEQKNAPYVQHKLVMEDLVRAQARDHLIFRLPQVVGATPNPHTLTNFFRDRLLDGERFNVWANASRTIIDVDDVKTLCDHFIAKTPIRNRALNLYPPIASTALDLVRIMERVLNLHGNYEITARGSSPNVDAPEITEAAQACGIHFTSTYPEQVLRKYYG